MNTQMEARKTRVLQPFLVLLIALTLPTMPIAQEKSPDTIRDLQALVHALQKGGYVIYFRHAATDHSQTDSDRVDFKNCATQRPLSEEGREQSRVIGKAFVALRIKVAKVITSPYCRCIDMGRLAFGEVTIDNDLAFAIKQPELETKRLAAALRHFLGTKPPEGANTVLIAHTANLKEAAEIWPKLEGVAHVFQPHGDSGFSHVGMVLPEEWAVLAQLK